MNSLNNVFITDANTCKGHTAAEPIMDMHAVQIANTDGTSFPRGSDDGHTVCTRAFAMQALYGDWRQARAQRVSQFKFGYSC